MILWKFDYSHDKEIGISEYRTSTIIVATGTENSSGCWPATEVLFASLGLIILVLGTWGNLLNILLFDRLKSLNRLASSLFLLVSFIASEGVLVTGLLTRVIYGFSGVDPIYTSVIFCKIRWMIRSAVNAISLTCVCLAAIDRYYISCHHVQRHRVITITKARWMILITILFWSAVFSSYAVFYTAPTPLSCTITDPIFSYFVSYFNLLHYSVVPLIILTTFCFLTWRNLGQQPATFLNGGKRLRDQVTRMLIFQSVMICMTSVPNMIWQIYSVTTNTIPKSALRQMEEDLINTVCILIGHLTHASAFYVYIFASPIFRRNVKKIFCQTRHVSPTNNTGTLQLVHVQEAQRNDVAVQNVPRVNWEKGPSFELNHSVTAIS